MKIKKLLILTVIPMLCLSAYAQSDSNTPKKGDFTLAATVGYNSYASVNAFTGLGQTDFEARALSTNWTDKKLMVGFEGGWFFHDDWKLNLGGGLNFTNNPGYTSVPGTIDENTTPGDGSIPNYRAVADGSSLGFNVFTGVDRYFKIKGVPGLMWYAGARIGYAYAQNRMNYDEEEVMGKSVAESFNLRGALTAGIDYYVLPAMYVGVQIDPVTYTYNTTTYKPQEGLPNLSADSHNYSLLAAPTLKIGFKF